MRIVLAVLIALVPATVTADEGVHVAIAAGIGLAQGLLGGHIQVREAHLAVFAGTGLIFSTTLGGDSFGSRGYGGVIGARWYSGDSGDRFFLSPQFAFSTQRTPGDAREQFPPVWDHSNATTLTAGWRFRSGNFLLDLGAGGGISLGSSTNYRAHPIPDITLAIGYEF